MDMGSDSLSPKWDELIPDALVLIFKKLSLCEILTVLPAVCKSWQSIVLGPYCWQEIDIEDWTYYMDPEMIHRMLELLLPRSCGSLQELSICNNITDESVLLIGKHAKSLKKLKIASSRINDKIMETVAPMLFNITSLDLKYCRDIGAPSLRAIGEHCTRLEFLDITSCSSVNMDEELVKKFSKLELLGPSEEFDSDEYIEYDDYLEDTTGYDNLGGYDNFEYDYLYEGYEYGGDFSFKFAAWEMDEVDPGEFSGFLD